MKPVVIKMNSLDNVAIVGNVGGLESGTVVLGTITLKEQIPQSHKVALRDFVEGDKIIRYGVVIGFARQAIQAGEWINEHKTRMPEPRSLHNLPLATTPEQQLEPLTEFTFEGYRNQNGSVGTRNILGITSTVQCVSGVVDHAVEEIKRTLLHKFPNVDDVVSLEHTYGCGVAIDAPGAEIPIRTIRNISQNPNFGDEIMVVSLGCEKLQPTRLFAPGSIPIHTAETQSTTCLQKQRGFVEMINMILAEATVHLTRLNTRVRETVPASELVVGTQCGGSDAFSGVTANPAVGYAADLLVRAGATVMFSENTEVRDAVEQLTSRSSTREVAQQVIDQLDWYDRYLDRGGVDRSANTTPGNKAGGLNNIVEKAMGSVAKSGSSAISHVLAPGEKLRSNQRGLVFAATPASDFVCGTLQLAAGMNVHIFTTGRGTPYNLSAVPVIKVATQTDLAERWHDIMDFNAGTIADGNETIEEAGTRLFLAILAAASGKKTWGEQHKIANSIVLFNPAPIT